VPLRGVCCPPDNADVKHHSNMHKPVVWFTSLSLALMLLLGVSETYARFTAESRGTSTAVAAATALGLDLRKFKGPSISGSHLWGTESFHWEALAADGSENRLSLLMSDERLCWSTVRSGEVQDHGCVVAKVTIQ
jgi:hypothetical protein